MQRAMTKGTLCPHRVSLEPRLLSKPDGRFSQDWRLRPVSFRPMRGRKSRRPIRFSRSANPSAPQRWANLVGTEWSHCERHPVRSIGHDYMRRADWTPVRQRQRRRRLDLQPWRARDCVPRVRQSIRPADHIRDAAAGGIWSALGLSRGRLRPVCHQPARSPAGSEGRAPSALPSHPPEPSRPRPTRTGLRFAAMFSEQRQRHRIPRR